MDTRGDIFRLYENAKKAAAEAEKEIKTGGTIGDGILIQYMASIRLEDLEQIRFQLNKIIKKKKELLRIKYNAGNVDKLVNRNVTGPNQR